MAFEQANGIARGALGGPSDSTVTFSIFATFPASDFGDSLIGPFIDQVVGTALLVMLVFAVVDTENQPPRSNLAPLVIGLFVAAVGMSFGANAGYAINPARDFGLRLFTWLAGWDEVAFAGINGYWWVPIAAPFLGGALGAWLYDNAVHKVLQARGGRRFLTDVEARGETVRERPRAEG